MARTAYSALSQDSDRLSTAGVDPGYANGPADPEDDVGARWAQPEDRLLPANHALAAASRAASPPPVTHLLSDSHQLSPNTGRPPNDPDHHAGGETASASQSPAAASHSPAAPSQSPAAASAHHPSFWGGLMNTFSRTRLPVVFTDGVFGNLVAKDETPRDNCDTADAEDPARAALDDENDDLTPAGQPPTYEEASADATPSYWESTLLAAGYGDEIIVGDMPVGSVIVFILNMLLCVALGYFGFFLGYMFHTTHAGKNGSLAGLGGLMIVSSQEVLAERTAAGGPAPAEVAPVDPNSFKDGPAIGYVLHPTGRPASEQIDQSTDSSWFGFFLLAMGVALILYACFQYTRALVAYYRIKLSQSEAEGVPYRSPREALQRVWDSIYQYARPGARPEFASAPLEPIPPPPGSPPLEPHQQHPPRAVETV